MVRPSYDCRHHLPAHLLTDELSDLLTHLLIFATAQIDPVIHASQTVRVYSVARGLPHEPLQDRRTPASGGR